MTTRFLLSILLVVVLVTTGCMTTGGGPWERSGQRNYGAAGGGIGLVAGATAGAIIGGKGGALIGALVGGVAGSLIGSGIGGAVNAGQDPQLLCDRFDEDRFGQPCLRNPNLFVPAGQYQYDSYYR
jgi:hypothetical protein